MRIGFPVSEDFEHSIPVYCVTPGHPSTIHRFFDSSPFSPSGRYLGALQLPTEERLPRPDEEATVVVVDLVEGSEREVATTQAWDTQVGAHVCWGASDEHLLFNTFDGGLPRAIDVNPGTGESTMLDSPVYGVSADGSQIVSGNLLEMAVTQPGYGVRLRGPTRSDPAPTNEGVLVSDLESHATMLEVSIDELVAKSGIDPDGELVDRGLFYLAHTSFSPDATRLLVVKVAAGKRRSPADEEACRHVRTIQPASAHNGARPAVGAWRASPDVDAG